MTSLTREEAKAFEDWLTMCYRLNPTIDFAVLAQALKVIRAQAK